MKELIFTRPFVKQRDELILQTRNWDSETSKLNLTWCAYSWIIECKAPRLPFISTAFGVLSICEHHSIYVSSRTCIKWVPRQRCSSMKHKVCINREAENATQSFLVPIEGFLLQHHVFWFSRQLCLLSWRAR